ncbi:MAG: iron ABC transporter permease [Bacteroidota bacterium]
MEKTLRGNHALVFLFISLLLLFFLNIALGSVKIPFNQILESLSGQSEQNILNDIIWQFRFPKAITCIVAGASLATGGLLMQTLFRNALAGPDVLGLSAGASLLVSLTILSGNAIVLSNGPWAISIAASIGSGAVFLLIISIANRLRDNMSLLIIGLMIAAVTQSFVSVLQFVSKAEDLQAFMIWTLGSVGGTNGQEIEVMMVIFCIGGLISYSSIKSLNALLLGNNYAQSVGINLKRSRFLIVLATSLMTGVVTAFCGPIAFVGLAVPHMVRLMIRTSNHKILIPAVMIGGAILLLGCDILAQLPGSTQILPLNAVTSIIGAPVVIWMILKNKKTSV